MNDEQAPVNSTDQKEWDKFLTSIGLSERSGENSRRERLGGDNLERIHRTDYGCGGGRRVRPEGNGPDSDE